MVCDKVEAEAAEEEEAEAGYRIKSKNPTQRCGEQEPHTKIWGIQDRDWTSTLRGKH